MQRFLGVALTDTDARRWCCSQSATTVSAAMRAADGIAAQEEPPFMEGGYGSVEVVAEPGLLPIALLASAVLVVGVRETRL